MKVLVTGGRNFGDAQMMVDVFESIDECLGEITEIIEGDANGADKMAGELGKQFGIRVRKFPADWDKHRRAAGAIRNSQMLLEGKPDIVVAFPGGSGTRDMVLKARKAGLRVIDAEKTYRLLRAGAKDPFDDLTYLSNFDRANG